jgi:hypothetical protein
MRPLATLLVLLASSGMALAPAWAQAPALSSQAPPSSPPPASTTMPAGVKQHLQSLHYGDVQNLRRGPDGQWTGTATQNGVRKNVTVSPDGTTTAR